MSRAPTGEQSPSSKLTEQEVVAIKGRLSDGEGWKAVAEDYPVSESAIHHIKMGRTWTDV